MKREKIEDALLAMGVPAGIKGFNFIVHAVMIFSEIGTEIGIMKELYPEIAKRNDTSAPRVERDIRYAFEIARAREKNKLVEKYIGTINRNNSSSLKQLYMILRREEEIK